MGDAEVNVASALKAMPSLKRLHLSNDNREQYRHAASAQDGQLTSPPPTPSQFTHVGRKDAANRRASFRNVAKHSEATIFDSPEWRKSSAFGFYVLFWTVLAISSIRILLVNILNTGYPLSTRILGMLYQDIYWVAAVDLVMYLGMYVTFFGQVLVARNIIDWNKSGWVLQHVWQAAFLFIFVGIARYFEFCWIAQIFLVLHCLTFIMQQYSYSTYNAHLHSISKELDECLLLYNNYEKTNQEGPEHMELIERIAFCTEELDMQSKKVRYPNNVTAGNFFMFTMFPTVVYQLEYPRTNSIRWGYLFSKVLAVFGIYFLIIMQAEQYLYPIAVEAMALRDSKSYSAQQFFGLVLEMIPPFMIVFLLVFYLIWDAILNCIAELTYFGDREFYRDWWNSSSWYKFARDWNVPVHNFLLRHVYFSSISSLKLSKLQATILTFLLSAMVHELTMYVIFGRIRGYLLILQLSQLPLEVLCRTKFMRDRPVLGILSLWLGVCLGPSFLASLYLTF